MTKLNSFNFIKSKKNKIRKTMKGGMINDDGNDYGNDYEFSENIENNLNDELQRAAERNEDRKRGIFRRFRNSASRRLGKARNSARTLGASASRRLGKVRNGFGRGLNTVRRNISERFSRRSPKTQFDENKKKNIETIERIENFLKQAEEYNIKNGIDLDSNVKEAREILKEHEKTQQEPRPPVSTSSNNSQKIRQAEEYSQKIENAKNIIKYAEDIENAKNDLLKAQKEAEEYSKKNISENIEIFYANKLEISNIFDNINKIAKPIKVSNNDLFVKAEKSFSSVEENYDDFKNEFNEDKYKFLDYLNNETSDEFYSEKKEVKRLESEILESERAEAEGVEAEGVESERAEAEGPKAGGIEKDSEIKRIELYKLLLLYLEKKHQSNLFDEAEILYQKYRNKINEMTEMSIESLKDIKDCKTTIDELINPQERNPSGIKRFGNRITSRIGSTLSRGRNMAKSGTRRIGNTFSRGKNIAKSGMGRIGSAMSRFGSMFSRRSQPTPSTDSIIRKSETFGGGGTKKQYGGRRRR